MSSPHSETQGYVYAADKNGRVKIGWSKDPRKRMRQPDLRQARLLKVRLGDRRDERAVFHRLAEFKLSGEWFSDCDAVRRVFAEWHDPEWLDQPAGGWLPSGRFVLDESLLDDRPAWLDDSRLNRSTPRTTQRRWGGWQEREPDGYREPLALDGRAA